MLEPNKLSSRRTFAMLTIKMEREEIAAAVAVVAVRARKFELIHKTRCRK